MIVEEIELGGIQMPPGHAGDTLHRRRQPRSRTFPDPERFDIGRTPNRHLAFATGAHQCAGMALARLEGAIAISRFLARFPNYALDGEPVRGGRVRFRGFSSVPCVTGWQPVMPAAPHGSRKCPVTSRSSTEGDLAPILADKGVMTEAVTKDASPGQ